MTKNKFCDLLNKNPKLYPEFYEQYMSKNATKKSQIGFGRRYGFWLYERHKVEFLKAYKKYGIE
jgi:hypothetical protein